MDTANAVNEHYLGHVVELSEESDIEASEDIMAVNGMKLLAKGAKIDGRCRDRLLQHKLTKPLESMMRVVDGVGSRRIDRVAEVMLERHPLLSRVCGEASGRLLATALRNLVLTPQVDSLLSVYASHAPGKLEHAVGISLLCAAMAQDLGNSGGCDPQVMLMAGLLHDVGELYIDPAYLKPGVRLDPQQWKHIATHPIVGSRVLIEMPGAGQQVAKAVLHHHERLDGFGYPQGSRGEQLPLPGQVLAVAELLMGLLESGGNHAERADVAMKLVPGEFNRALLDRVVTAARRVDAMPEPGDGEATPADQLVQRVMRLADSMRRYRDVKTTIDAESPKYGAALRTLLGEAMLRCERIRVAFASTGLEGLNDQQLRDHVAAVDERMRREIEIVSRELQWRLGELERLCTMRAERLSPPELQQVKRVVERMTA